jgi:hypothetical protein
MLLGGFFDVPGRGARIAIGRGRDARLIAARAAACRGALGTPATDPGGGSILQLLPHPIELGGVFSAKATAG